MNVSTNVVFVRDIKDVSYKGGNHIFTLVGKILVLRTHVTHYGKFARRMFFNNKSLIHRLQYVIVMYQLSTVIDQFDKAKRNMSLNWRVKLRNTKSV